MRFRVIVGSLAVVLAISLGFNFYYYSTLVSKLAAISAMQGIIIVTWAKQMSVASYHLEDVATNIDVHGVRPLLQTASDIAWSAEISDGTLYWQMSHTAIYVSEELGPYEEGYPTYVKLINSSAIGMIKNLAQKIRETAGLILNESISGQDGANFIQRLKENGIQDEIINGCVDIQNLSGQIYDFNPKFQ